VKCFFKHFEAIRSKHNEIQSVENEQSKKSRFHRNFSDSLKLDAQRVPRKSFE
jgi:hypothetical protein